MIIVVCGNKQELILVFLRVVRASSVDNKDKRNQTTLNSKKPENTLMRQAGKFVSLQLSDELILSYLYETLYVTDNKQGFEMSDENFK